MEASNHDGSEVTLTEISIYNTEVVGNVWPLTISLHYRRKAVIIYMYVYKRLAELAVLEVWNSSNHLRKEQGDG